MEIRDVERTMAAPRVLLLSSTLLLAAAGCGSSDMHSPPPTGQPPAEGAAPSGTSQGPVGGASNMGAIAGAGAGDAAASSGVDGRAGSNPTSRDAMSSNPMATDASATQGEPDASAGPDDAADGSPPAVVTCTPGSTLAPGDSNGSIDVGGTMRSYILHVPSSVTGQTPVPLVVDFHPILATNTFEQGNSGYQTLADQEGFIVAFPQGIDNAWNIGPCCTMSRSVDDLGFARALVTQIENQGCIDPKRVYAVGYSMGGGMSHYLACNAADVFASVAPAAFDLLEESEEPCHPSRPITVISFRGTADTIVPYNGGASNPPNGLGVTIHFLGAQGTFQKWAMLDGCTDSAPSTPDINGCSTYSQCQAGVEVTLCTSQGGGHVTGDPNIGWAMLKKHPMP